VTTTIKVPEGHTRLPRDLETACFRIVQEALTNVARHAQAKNVHISLEALEKGLSLSIKDDGIGFDERSRTANGSPHRLGLQGMKERALALGGKLHIESVFSKGTEIRVNFPNGTKRD
jgi:signal transduction histidine kinase